jgi:exosortase/archaeosortase family protein
MGVNPVSTTKSTNSAGRGRFIIVFLLVVGGYFGLSSLEWVDREVVLPVLKVSAAGASWLLALIGVVTQTDGVLVKGPEFSVAVRSGCDPLAPIALMSGAMLGFPASWRQRLLGMVGGGVILFGLNLVRVASLYLTGRAHSSWFYSLHQEWWPAAFIVIALLLWWVWLNWVQQAGRTTRG